MKLFKLYRNTIIIVSGAYVVIGLMLSGFKAVSSFHFMHTAILHVHRDTLIGSFHNEFLPLLMPILLWVLLILMITGIIASLYQFFYFWKSKKLQTENLFCCLRIVFLATISYFSIVLFGNLILGNPLSLYLFLSGSYLPSITSGNAMVIFYAGVFGLLSIFLSYICYVIIYFLFGRLVPIFLILFYVLLFLPASIHQTSWSLLFLIVPSIILCYLSRRFIQYLDGAYGIKFASTKDHLVSVGKIFIYILSIFWLFLCVYALAYFISPELIDFYVRNSSFAPNYVDFLPPPSIDIE